MTETGRQKKTMTMKIYVCDLTNRLTWCLLIPKISLVSNDTTFYFYVIGCSFWVVELVALLLGKHIMLICS